jgi:protein arginine kinase
MDARERKEAANRALDAARRAGGPLADAAGVPRNEADPELLVRLLAARWVSPDWAGEPLSDRWALVGTDRALSVMIHEEDHLRIQSILPGLAVNEAGESALRTASLLGDSLEYAEAADVGYLTASLSNAGTGMRASVMLHLPALSVSRERDAVFDTAKQVGCTVRGLFGEGSHGTGELFQVSNTYTWRTTSPDTLARTEVAARHLVNAERKAREAQFGAGAGRASLKNAVRSALDSLRREEAAPDRLLTLVSVLRLGAAQGILAVEPAETAEWIAVAGMAPLPLLAGEERLRFEAVRRTSAIRQRLRQIASTSGTFTTGPAD